MSIAMLMLLVILAKGPAIRTNDVCDEIAGAAVVANDGAYLGRLTNKYDDRSVLNEYGDYGSKYSDKSIWNQYGDYGSKYSDKSPFDPYASEPPVLIKNRKAIAYLTVSTSLSPRVHPYVLKTCDFP